MAAKRGADGDVAGEDLPPVSKIVTVPGAGEFPRKGDFVTVHCTGYGRARDLGRKFWSTHDDGEDQFKFQLGGGDVIEGWEQALLTMRVGERAEYVHCRRRRRLRRRLRCCCRRRAK